MHKHTHIYNAHIYTSTQNAHTLINTLMHTRTYTHTHVHTHLYVCVRMCMCVYVQVVLCLYHKVLNYFIPFHIAEEMDGCLPPMPLGNKALSLGTMYRSDTMVNTPILPYPNISYHIFWHPPITFHTLYFQHRFVLAWIPLTPPVYQTATGIVGKPTKDK